jgi:hypothetical protein
MEKNLCIGSLVLAALMLILFLIDMITGAIFGAPFFVADIFGLLASGIVGYMAINALRDLR